MNRLLFDGGQLKTIVIVAACVLVVLALVYGVIKKFSRMSWLGWQTALLFCATLPLSSIKDPSNGTLLFGLAAGGLLGVTAIVFIIGALVRKPFLAMEQGGGGARAFNRIAGGVTSVFNIVVFVAMFGGLALVIMQPFNLGALSAVYENPFWSGFYSVHAYDFFLVFLFAACLRYGYRTGFLRMIVTITMLALTIFSIFLSMYMTLQVPFLASLAGKIAGTMKINSIAAGWIGFAVTSFLVAFVFLIVIVIFSILLNMLLRVCGKSHAFVVLDGVLFALIMSVILLVFVVGFNFGVSYMIYAAENGTIEEAVPQLGDVAAQMGEYFKYAENVFVSSPLSNIFYTYNPLRLLLQ